MGGRHRGGARLALIALLIGAGQGASSNSKVVFPDTEDTYSSKWTWDPDDPSTRPALIAHRGASGMFPEHTAMAYEAAAEQGADYVECDIVITRDLVLVCSHEPWISEISNVANNSIGGPEHPDFSDRLNTYDIHDDDPDFNWNDKGNVTDYFVYDFTLDELLTLRRKQARDYRDPNFDWEESFVTFEEYMATAKDLGFGIYPEIKHGAAANEILADELGSDTMESLVAAAMEKAGFSGEDDPCYVQSFERSSLALLQEAGNNCKQVMLLGSRSQVVSTDKFLAEYADAGAVAIGLDKDLLVKVGADGHVARVNGDLVNRIHSFGMEVSVYTFRNEPVHLNWDYGQDPYVEYEKYLELGIDAYFTDFPASLSRFFRAKELERAAESGDKGNFQTAIASGAEVTAAFSAFTYAAAAAAALLLGL